MVTLTLLESHTNQPLQRWEFPSQSVIRIGRSENNEIVLHGYFQVSRQHLELTKVEQEWQLVSRGTNGTLVNNVLVNEATLKDKDLIRLAENGPLFRFELTPSVEADNSNSELHQTDLSCRHTGNPPDSIFCMHCGKPLVEQEEFVGPYQILRTIGKGGMGTTYLVWDKTQKKQGAPLLSVLKEMNADMMRIPKARELFEREARVLKSLDHPGIPKYYDFFVVEDRKYLVMELIHGHNLEQFIYQRGALDQERAIRWMIQVCNILTYLHNLNPPLVHRDVKPANLILRNLDSRLMLLDFGAVKELGTSLETRIGVEGYSAPEQYRGKPCPQSDIYGIGATLIFLITGKTPMQYYCYKGAKYEFDTTSIPNLTPSLSKVIEKACRSDFRDRYQNSEELSAALETCLAQ